MSDATVPTDYVEQLLEVASRAARLGIDVTYQTTELHMPIVARFGDYGPDVSFLEVEDFETWVDAVEVALKSVKRGEEGELVDARGRFCRKLRARGIHAVPAGLYSMAVVHAGRCLHLAHYTEACAFMDFVNFYDLRFSDVTDETPDPEPIPF